MTHDSPHVDVLKRWLVERAGLLATGRVIVGEAQLDSPAGQAAFVDLEGRRAWARVTVWPPLYADVIVLDAKTGESLSGRHVERLTLSDLDDVLAVVAEPDRELAVETA